MNGSDSSRYFVWGLDLSQTLQGAGGIGGLLCMANANTSYYYLYDANGNVTQLVNAADGSIAAHYEYDPFGNFTAKSGPYADANPFRFSTKYFDADTGQYDFGLRDYSAKLGRWTSRDPIGEQGGANLYVFVDDDPINEVDPYGMRSRRKRSPDRGETRRRFWINGYFDSKGWELFSHWIWGEGEDLLFDFNQSWSDYMMANKLLKEQLQAKLKLETASRLLGEISGPVNLKLNSIEIENGYRTGYEMLHGPNRDVGGFTVTGAEPKRSKNGCGFKYNLTYTWNDLIDPNKKYVADKIYSELIRSIPFSNPEDYYVRIKWKADSEIYRKNNLLLEGIGYPF